MEKVFWPQKRTKIIPKPSQKQSLLVLGSTVSFLVLPTRSETDENCLEDLGLYTLTFPQFLLMIRKCVTCEMNHSSLEYVLKKRPIFLWKKKFQLIKGPGTMQITREEFLSIDILVR